MPKRYCTWEPDSFYEMMKLLGAPSLPMEFDIVRYFKVMTTITKLLENDPEIDELLFSKLNENIHYVDSSLMLAVDFCNAFT